MRSRIRIRNELNAWSIPVSLLLHELDAWPLPSPQLGAAAGHGQALSGPGGTADSEAVHAATNNL